MRISVVIPTRDRPDLLARALASVRGQVDVAADQIIVVDDGASPIAGVVGDDVTIVDGGRRGAAQARNAGAAVATGDAIAFLDDDDWWLPTKLARQSALLQARPDAVAVGCGLRIHVGGGRFVHRPMSARDVGFRDLLVDRVMEVYPSTVVVRRGAFVSVGGFDPAVPHGIGEDWDLLLRLARTGPIAVVAEELAVMDRSVESHFAGRWNAWEEAIDFLVGRYPEMLENPRGAARVLGQLAFWQVAGGKRQEGVSTAMRAMRRRPLEPRWVLTLLVAAGLPPQTVLDALARRGRSV